MKSKINEVIICNTTNYAPGGRAVVAYQFMGGTPSEEPSSFVISTDSPKEYAIVIGGDLANIEYVRGFWQSVIQTLEQSPDTIWLNLTKVNRADTKLAACLVAILRRADAIGTTVQIVSSNEVESAMKLCKVPPLKQFTNVRKAA